MTTHETAADPFANTPIPDYIDDLVPMDLFIDNYPIAIDILYRQPNRPENHFGKVYRDDARLWLHRDLAAVTLLASQAAKHHFDWQINLFDGLRTTTAQTVMFGTDKVKSKSAEWQETFISSPGTGSHPRGLAIDCYPTLNDRSVNMGTVTNYLADDEANNPAARFYLDFGENRDEIFANRFKLKTVFQWATHHLGHSLWQNTLGLYPDEWWHHDFYIPRRDEFPVISDVHLPKSMRMTDRYLDHPDPQNSPGRDDWATLADTIHDQVQSAARTFNL